MTCGAPTWVITLQLLSKPAVPAPIKKAIARLTDTSVDAAMPSWAIAVISPNPPIVRKGERQKRALLRCNTRPPLMLPAASTLVKVPRSRGHGDPIQESLRPSTEPAPGGKSPPDTTRLSGSALLAGSIRFAARPSASSPVLHQNCVVPGPDRDATETEPSQSAVVSWLRQFLGPSTDR